MTTVLALFLFCAAQDGSTVLKDHAHLLRNQPGETALRPSESLRRLSWAAWRKFPVGSWNHQGSKRTTVRKRGPDQIDLEVRTKHPSWKEPVVRTEIIRRPDSKGSKTRSVLLGGRRVSSLYWNESEKCCHATEVNEVWFQKDAPQFLVRSRARTDRKATWDYRITKWNTTFVLEGKKLPAYAARAKGWDGRRWVEMKYVLYNPTGILLRAEKTLRNSPRPKDKRGMVFGKTRIVYQIVSTNSMVKVGGKTVSCVMTEQYGDYVFQRNPDPGWKPHRAWYSVMVPGGLAKRRMCLRTSSGIREIQWALDDFAPE